MKCICLECGEVFDEDDIVYIEEDRGEFWGMPCTETVACSPCCKGSYDEAAIKQISLDIVCAKDETYGDELALEISKLLRKHGYVIEGEGCTASWSYEEYGGGGLV